MSTVLSYKKDQVKMDGSIEDIKEGYNVWVDVIDPDEKELDKLAKKFNLNSEAIKTCFNKSKIPEIRQFDKHTFTVMVDMKNKDPETLLTEAVYFFLGKNWLVTIHSPEVNVNQIVERLFNIQNETIKNTRIDALYYNILAGIVTKYEQLLTALELSVNEYQRRSFVRPLPVIFESIDTLSRQAIMLRRQFWHVRNIINFLLHTEKDKDDVKYVEMVHDDITQLIDFVESYESTINSIRELYVAKVSLQINETMRILTIFTVILLPLALIVGIYGMNGIDLKNITEIPLGFVVVLATMVVTVLAFVLFFIRKRWIIIKRGDSDVVPNSKSTNSNGK
ncbi:MAG TPA: magnesium transporter CorA family protein [Nitrososphaeraceae archaeon]|nr:magnesium transporter CorA family protein [Nitrososphaeraceae archaeon]